MPAWSVGTILNGILSFMLEATPTVGSVETTLAQKRIYARLSHAHNRRDKLFKLLFPHLLQAAPEGEASAEAEAEAEALAASKGLLASPFAWLAVLVAILSLGAMIMSS